MTAPSTTSRTILLTCSSPAEPVYTTGVLVGITGAPIVQPAIGLTERELAGSTIVLDIVTTEVIIEPDGKLGRGVVIVQGQSVMVSEVASVTAYVLFWYVMIVEEGQ